MESENQTENTAETTPMTTSRPRPIHTRAFVASPLATRLSTGTSSVAIADANRSCESAVLITAAITAVNSAPSTTGWKKTSETTK